MMGYVDRVQTLLCYLQQPLFHLGHLEAPVYKSARWANYLLKLQIEKTRPRCLARVVGKEGSLGSKPYAR